MFESFVWFTLYVMLVLICAGFWASITVVLFAAFKVRKLNRAWEEYLASLPNDYERQKAQAVKDSWVRGWNNE